MHENHAREQYFFDAPTLDALAVFVATFERPCLLCAPMLGRVMHERGRKVRVLDVDAPGATVRPSSAVPCLMLFHTRKRARHCEDAVPWHPTPGFSQHTGLRHDCD